MIGSFLVGLLCGGVIAFLVWRNNKKKFVEALETIDGAAELLEDKDILAKIKTILGG